MEGYQGYDNLTIQSQRGHTLFIKHSTLREVTVLVVYVEDIILTENDWKEQQVLSQCIAKEFEIKTLGRLKYFLGIEAAYSKKVFSYLNKNVIDLLKETSKAACKSTSTPIDSSLKLGNTDECAAVDKEI